MRLSVDRQEQLINSLVRRLSGWGLSAPSIALLETHKPLSFVASQTLLAFQPLLTLFLGDAPLGEYASLLEDRSSVDRIIYRLEQLQHDSSILE